MRSVGLVSQCKTYRSAIQHSCPKLLLGKHHLGTFLFPEGTASTVGKDQLVGGVWTGPTKHGTLRLVSKHLLVLQLFQNFVRPLHLVCYLDSSVRLAQVSGLHKDKTSVYEMGKCRNTVKSGEGAQKDASPTPSSHGGELDDTAQDQIEEGALMEEVLSQMGASPKMLFRFTQLSRLPSICFLLLKTSQ